MRKKIEITLKGDFSLAAKDNLICDLTCLSEGNPCDAFEMTQEEYRVLVGALKQVKDRIREFVV